MRFVRGYEIPQYMGVASHLLPGRYEFFSTAQPPTNQSPLGPRSHGLTSLRSFLEKPCVGTPTWRFLGPGGVCSEVSPQNGRWSSRIVIPFSTNIDCFLVKLNCTSIHQQKQNATAVEDVDQSSMKTSRKLLLVQVGKEDDETARFYCLQMTSGWGWSKNTIRFPTIGVWGRLFPMGCLS